MMSELSCCQYKVFLEVSVKITPYMALVVVIEPNNDSPLNVEAAQLWEDVKGLYQ